MSLPAFPDKPVGYSLADSISQILASVAMEEIGLSHIINAEGEKLQYVLGTYTNQSEKNPTIAEILSVNESVKDTLGAVLANQMLLFVKMSSALGALFKNHSAKNTDGGNGEDPGDPKSPVRDVPEAVDGRVLSPEKTGDSADWIEIARNGAYSLIVRATFIHTYAQQEQYDNPDFQTVVFGTSNDYANSDVRRIINDWFDGTAEGSADNLAAEANLRGFTVKSDAAGHPGIGTGGPDGKNDSFSKPVVDTDSPGFDTAFALSYSEAANFVSAGYSWGGGNYLLSDQPAPSNFAKLQVPGVSTGYSQIWLRSPGTDTGMVSTLGSGGRVFQTAADGSTGGTGFVYPALWVKSEIFEAV